MFVTSRSGSLTDGSGPIENYLDDNTAYWLIDPQTVEDTITDITINFSEFDLQAGDTLKVYDGGSTEDRIAGRLLRHHDAAEPDLEQQPALPGAHH